MKLAAKGECASAGVAELCGISRSRLFVWLGCVRGEGLEALLQREKPGPREGTFRGVAPAVIAGLAERLAANQFASAEAARRWLQKEHGVERPYGSVWQWLKKLKGVLRVPRPSHSREKSRCGGGVQKRTGGKA